MLDLINVRKTFNKGTINQRVALDGINLHLEDGDFVTVIGGNGAGKSTMLNAVAGVWPVDDGRIILDGEDITALPDYKRAKYIGRVFQDPMMGTAPNMQLEENLALAMRRGQRRGLGWGVTRAEREEYREKLRGLADYWANITCVPCSALLHWAQPCSRNGRLILLHFPNWPNNWTRTAYAAASASWL